MLAKKTAKNTKYSGCTLTDRTLEQHLQKVYYFVFGEKKKDLFLLANSQNNLVGTLNVNEESLMPKLLKPGKFEDNQNLKKLKQITLKISRC